MNDLPDCDDRFCNGNCWMFAEPKQCVTVEICPKGLKEESNEI